MHLRLLTIITAAAGMMGLFACSPRESDAERRHDANTVAGKLGQGAHRAAVEADRAGRVIEKKLDKAAHDAREGWKEDERKTRKHE